MGKVEFEKVVREARLLSPLLGFKTSTQQIEFRRDPLTGRWSRINLERIKRVRQARGEEKEVKEIIERSKRGCYFCPENIEKSTPRFPWEPDRIRVGSAWAFPNLFPFGEFHAVVTISGEHWLPLDKFSPRLIEDSLKASLEYFRKVWGEHPSVKYCSINWNHMPSAAASILHPHLQILADREPTTHVEELMRKSREYFERTRSNYWSGLVETERETGERFILNTGSVAWLTSFAPQGNNEVIAVFKEGISNLLQLGESELSDFSAGLSKILSGYHALGIDSFNLTTFSGPNGVDLSDHYLLNAKLISRPSFGPAYVSDSGFMERFQYETIFETRPENVTQKMRRAIG